MDSIEEHITQALRPGALEEAVKAGFSQVIDALKDAAALLDPKDLTQLLETTFRSRNAFEASVSRCIRSLDTATYSAGDREISYGLDTPQWLSSTLKITTNAAYAQVQLARELPELPAVSRAFAMGEISSQHAGVVARCVRTVERGGGPRQEAESQLLDQAGCRDPRDLLRWGLGLVHKLAPRQLESQEERQHERRFFRIEKAFGGGYDIQGYLDPIGGDTLKSALNGLLGPRPKDDFRSHNQRRADGVVQLARRVLDSGELPTRGGVRPHLNITATLDTLLANPGAPAALLDWGWPISGKALRKVAQDAEIIPIVVDEKGNPLKVGRRYRTATPKMRVALAVRDRGCAWPGCDRPPDWSQGHHETEWCRGGKTDVDEMSLLCSRHHPLLSRGWTLERLPDRQVVVHLPVGWNGVTSYGSHGPP